MRHLLYRRGFNIKIIIKETQKFGCIAWIEMNDISKTHVIIITLFSSVSHMLRERKNGF